MKSEKTKKKLSLNKETVAHLGRVEMDEVMGGCTFTVMLSYLTMCDECDEESIRGKRPSTPCNED